MTKTYTTKTYNDVLYLFIIATLTELFLYSVNRGVLLTAFIFGFLGIVALELWFFRAMSLFAQKRISKYSDVVMKISKKRRFFGYFILPALFYISLLVFLFYNRNFILGHVVLTVCMSLLLILFLNVKGSLSDYYSQRSSTKSIYDFICISTLYLVLNALLRIGLSDIYFFASSFIAAFALFIFTLKLHDRIEWISLGISCLSAISVVLSMLAVWGDNIFVIPAVGTLIFYMIVSIWNIKFSGKLNLTDYVLPVAYTLLALILVLTC